MEPLYIGKQWNEVILSLITRSLTRGLLVHFGWMWNVHSIRLLNTMLYSKSLCYMLVAKARRGTASTIQPLHCTTSTTAQVSHNYSSLFMQQHRAYMVCGTLYKYRQMLLLPASTLTDTYYNFTCQVNSVVLVNYNFN